MAKKEKSAADVLPVELARAFDEWSRLGRELRTARTPSEIHALREQKAAFEQKHGRHAKDLFERAEAYLAFGPDDDAGIVMKNVWRVNNVRCEPALWSSFAFERNSKTSPSRELLIQTFVNMSAPANLSNREVVKLIAANADLPVESLPDALDKPVFLRSRVIYGFLGNALDEIARDYGNMQWWLSDHGLNMAIVSPPNAGRAPTFDELISGLMIDTPHIRGSVPAESALVPMKSRKTAPQSPVPDHKEKPRGKGGRPPKDQTGAIQAKWAEMGNPKPTAAICDKLANHFFAGELKGINRGTPEHRKVRERVRQAIQRGARASAT